MPMFQVRNRRTKMVLGEVVVDDPTKILDGLMDATGCSIEEIAHSLGSTVEKAKAALDITLIAKPNEPAVAGTRSRKPSLPARSLFA